MSRPAPLHVPPLDPAGCQVWWARLTDCQPAHQRLLDPVEASRRQAYRSAADQDRFTLGVVLTRTVLAARLGVPPDQVKLDRTCPDCDRPHGRPRLVSDSGWGATAGGGIGPGQLAFSISHSGEFVGAAFATAPAVGLDVELVVPARAEGLVDAVLSAAEHEDFDRTDPDRRGSDFFRYWVRKEAVVKATGDGLRVPLRDLTVSAADQPPRLVEWTGRPGVAAQFALYDLDGAAGHAASLAVIGGPVVVQEYDAGALIRQPVPD